MLRRLTCKDAYTSNLRESREVLKQNTLNFSMIFCAKIKNFLAFTAYFFALLQTCQRERKTYIDLVRVCSTRRQQSSFCVFVLFCGKKTIGRLKLSNFSEGVGD